MTGGDRPAWVDDELFPFQSRFVDIDGHTVHYIDEGSGPTLLFLHGNPTWSFVYRDVIHALRDEFRCVALDYPGFGLSSTHPGGPDLPEAYAGVVAAFVGRLDLSEITLVMHDWGGPIGLGAAEQLPARFSHLVVANTWAWPFTGDLTVEVVSRVMGGPVGRALTRRFNFFVNAMIPTGHRLRKPTAAEMTHYRQALSPAERREAAATLPRQITASNAFLTKVEDGLADLASLPTLIIWGDRDVAFRAKERERWEQMLPHHETVVIEGAGHFVQSDAPDRFAAAIRDWHGRPNAAGTPSPGDASHSTPTE